MNGVQGVFGAIFLTLTIPFTAAADGHRKYDFRIPAQHFTSGAHPGASPQNVPINCSDDFNWQINPPQPTPQLLERIDTLGFGGGQMGTIAFLRMDAAQRGEYLGAMNNQWAKAHLQRVAASYDAAENKTIFLIHTMRMNHQQWDMQRLGQISAECERRDLTN